MSKLKKPSDFIIGHIYQMSPGYHTKQPYFVEVIDVGDNYIITNIPDKRQLKISLENNWDYHIKRFKHFGEKEKFSHLLLNQIIK